MIDGLPLVDLGATALLGVVFLLVITDRLVWHKRLAAEQERADRLEQVVLKAIGTTERATLTSEIVAEVLTHLPDPGARAARDDEESA